MGPPTVCWSSDGALEFVDEIERLPSNVIGHAYWMQRWPSLGQRESRIALVATARGEGSFATSARIAVSASTA
jgi:hypothetical protein